MSDNHLEARFPCAQCGADLRFDAGEQKLACDYCGHQNYVDFENAPIQELDFRAALEEELSNVQVETTQVSNCDTCGAQVEFDKNIHADRCVFCDSVLVKGTGPHRHFKPKGVLPFVLTEDDARNALERWLGSRWFAPSGLKRFAREEQGLNGVYIPYWTFDADTQSNYTGQRGTVYYVEQTVTVMTDRGPRRTRQRVPRIRWTGVRGRVRRYFDDVLAVGSQSLPKHFTDALEPWDLHALVPYSPGFLAGFRAEAYTIDLREGFADARGTMDLLIRRDVRFDIGGDQQRVHSVETEFGDVSFKHILLPLWIAAYRYRGKVYRFTVNGRSGQVFGERPYSWWKIAFAVIAGALLMLALMIFLSASGALDQVTVGGGRVILSPGGGLPSGFDFPQGDPFRY